MLIRFCPYFSTKLMSAFLIEAELLSLSIEWKIYYYNSIFTNILEYFSNGSPGKMINILLSSSSHSGGNCRLPTKKSYLGDFKSKNQIIK